MQIFPSLKHTSIFAIVTSAFLAISPANALDIKQEIINSCVNDIVSNQLADSATANQFCSCTTEVQSKMTFGQMWEIESYAQSGKDPATLSYAAKMQQDLRQCTNGLTFNRPQQP